MTDEDIKIIKSEATFVEEYYTPVSNLSVELETSKKTMCHLLYTKINEVRKIFSIVKNASDVKSVLYENTKSSLALLSSQKRKNLENRITYVSKRCDQLFTEYLSSDLAKSLFTDAQTLFKPSKIITTCNTETKLTEAKSNLSLFPSANFKVLHVNFKLTNL